MKQQYKRYIVTKAYKKEPWYKRNIKQFLKEEKEKYIPILIIILIFSLWSTTKNKNFIWTWYTIMEDLPLNRGLLSALTYLTIGSLIYSLGFYLLLYNFFVKTLKSRKLYLKVKGVVWFILMFVMYKYIAPFFIILINGVATIFINIFNFISYICLPLGISILVGIIFFLLHYYKKI